MEATEIRRRGPRLRLKVNFPDGDIICHISATDTLIQTLCKIGSDHFEQINLQMNHRPLLSQEVYPELAEYMKPVCDGWYINTQSDTATKLLQLKEISRQLNLGFTVEMGMDFETSRPTNKERGTRKAKGRLKVTLADGRELQFPSYKDVFVAVIKEIGVAKVALRKLNLNSTTPWIATTNNTGHRVELEPYRWLAIPNGTKDAARFISLLAKSFGERISVIVE